MQPSWGPVDGVGWGREASRISGSRRQQEAAWQGWRPGAPAQPSPCLAAAQPRRRLNSGQWGGCLPVCSAQQQQQANHARTRTPARTLKPAARSCCTTRRPVLPVAPATKTFAPGCSDAAAACNADACCPRSRNETLLASRTARRSTAACKRRQWKLGVGKGLGLHQRSAVESLEATDQQRGAPAA